jgi:hypothetical protein
MVAGAFDKKIFENEGVLPAIERAAATEATHLRIHGRERFDLH